MTFNALNCPRGVQERCNHTDPAMCCGGGYDGNCPCTSCHVAAASKDEALLVPLCACIEVYGSHHPECPVTRKIERLQAALERIATCKPGPDGSVAWQAVRIATEALRGCAETEISQVQK